ncbi:aconitate hydratase AcnA [Granulosicoccus sp. 3-233]|uniref:aconitate hydratase AcnA n=1 Tax=Granulosicoccus sp. 3-233 TaxID=3417969 RepID=UPI003D34436E
MKHIDVEHESGPVRLLDLPALLGHRLVQLPMVLRILVENHIRLEGADVIPRLLHALDDWLEGKPCEHELTLRPNRLLMHDTTCTPALVDLAAMRDVLAHEGLNPASLKPTLPVDVSVDHSTAVDHYASPAALPMNLEHEYERNRERYAFMKWAANCMGNITVHPPGTGIMHTLNLEQLSSVVHLEGNSKGSDGYHQAYPDFMVGTDSHTPMVNGLGVLGWGIGGLEAEGIALGQAITMKLPRVTGVKLLGKLKPGVQSTDLALRLTHELRMLDVTGDFVEFHGPGVSGLSVGERAVVANMAPEYGATTGYFPVDGMSIDYLAATNRPAHQLDLVRTVLSAMGLWFDPQASPRYDKTLTLDLASVRTRLAGPRRPQDLLSSQEARGAIERVLQRKLNADEPSAGNTPPDGAVGIAAITSCTNTTDPALLITAGLLARAARERGLQSKPWVKTSLAPGSPSARQYLVRAGLLPDLEQLGFHIVGFGCTTCIGNSGPLPAIIESALEQEKAVVAVLSGNRNFPGRVHPKLNLGLLASPALVIAYALKGDVLEDIQETALGIGNDGKPVYLHDIWPSAQAVQQTLLANCLKDDVTTEYLAARRHPAWDSLKVSDSQCFPWSAQSSSLRPPPFAARKYRDYHHHFEANPLLALGDDITTDHISPAGWVDPLSAAGQWLRAAGETESGMTVYAAYRGNWEVMLRGAFSNMSVVNHLGHDIPAGYTRHAGTGELVILTEAARRYRSEHRSTVIVAGHRFGMGSSRDWAAKAIALLGVRAVIALSFERIHRTNLIGMGVLPLVLSEALSNGLTESSCLHVKLAGETLTPGNACHIDIQHQNGQVTSVAAVAAVETRMEALVLQKGGMFSHVLDQAMGHFPT